jgi:hypothetical protein
MRNAYKFLAGSLEIKDHPHPEDQRADVRTILKRILEK